MSQPEHSAVRILRQALQATKFQAAYDPLWVAAPAMAIAARKSQMSSTEYSTRTRLMDSANSFASIAFQNRGPQLRLQGRVLFVFDPHNPERTIRPILAALEKRSGKPSVALSQPVRARNLFAWTFHADRAVQVLGTDFKRSREPIPQKFLPTVFAAARALARAENLLATIRPSLVVVASQHATSSRAFIHQARKRSIPTLYIPHAPVANDVEYSDIPTDFVALRGEGEVEHYLKFGIGRSQLSVTGNPAAEINVPVQLDLRLPTIYAPSPYAPKEIERQVEAIHSVCGSDVIVAAHPRMRGKGEYESLWPQEWGRHGGPTLELLSHGHPVLIQSSSGIAWEALAHGIPTINVSLEECAASYPFIREPHVTMVGDSGNLDTAIANARLAACDTNLRGELTKWSRHWCAMSGVNAVDSILRIIDVAKQRIPASRPIFDGWADGGTAAS